MSVTVGPLALEALHVVLLGAFLVALAAGYWAGRKHQIKVSPTLFDMAFAALVGGRVGFVLIWFEQYLQAPLTMLDIRDGGFHPWSALIAGLVFACWRLRNKRQLREPVLVALLAGAAAGLIGGVPALMRMGENRIVPEIVLRATSGQLIALNRLGQGKPMVINLWATWCPPCRREMPVLARAQQQYSNVVFAFVSQGEDAETVSAYLSRANLAMRNVLLDPARSAGLALGSSALPTTLFYDERGQLVERHVGPLSAASLAAEMARIEYARVPSAP